MDKLTRYTHRILLGAKPHPSGAWIKYSEATYQMKALEGQSNFWRSKLEAITVQLTNRMADNRVLLCGIAISGLITALLLVAYLYE